MISASLQMCCRAVMEWPVPLDFHMTLFLDERRGQLEVTLYHEDMSKVVRFGEPAYRWKVNSRLEGAVEELREEAKVLQHWCKRG